MANRKKQRLIKDPITEEQLLTKFGSPIYVTNVNNSDIIPIAVAATSTQNLIVTNNAQIGSGTFYVDAQTNRVGMGTNKPGELLHVAGTAFIENLKVDKLSYAYDTSEGNFKRVIT
jgi:hypothetical protein